MTRTTSLKQRTVGEILQEQPLTLRIFEKHKIACRHCHFSRKETLEDAARKKNVPLSRLLMEIEAIMDMHSLTTIKKK